MAHPLTPTEILAKCDPDKVREWLGTLRGWPADRRTTGVMWRGNCACAMGTLIGDMHSQFHSGNLAMQRLGFAPYEGLTPDETGRFGLNTAQPFLAMVIRMNDMGIYPDDRPRPARDFEAIADTIESMLE